MASERLFCISVTSVVEDVLKQHGTRLSDMHLASRKAEEASARRYEASGWLRKMVGVVLAKDLPGQPSEEEFRLGLRNGLILCNALNKVQPGAVPKVVVNPGDSVLHPDGAALSAYQYFENVRNFLVAVKEIGLPMFEASDLEQGGKSARVVDCVLAVKSYGEWKQMGGHGSWKYSGNSKFSNTGKNFLRKNSEPFKNSLSRNQPMYENEVLCMEHNLNENIPIESAEMTSSRPLSMLVHAALSGKRPEEVPLLLESMLGKVMEEFEHRIASQTDLQVKTALKGLADSNKSFCKQKVSIDPPSASFEMKMEKEENNLIKSEKEGYIHKNMLEEEASKDKILKQHKMFEQQQRDIQELKHTLQTTRAGMEFMQIKYSEEFSKLGKHLLSLAHAASGYHKVLEENRKLYNQVQDLKGSIRVYCRVRPFLPGQLSTSSIGGINDGHITIITPSKYGKGHRSFNFNKVFGPSATQEVVFSDMQPLIRSVLDGYNICIFAYGQTGSGKTFTMSGPKDLNEQTQGVNYRALSDLFKLSEERRGAFYYKISVQMIEIYNEQVRDLLASDGLNKRLEIRNSSQKGLHVPDANLVPVTSTSDVIELMNIGQKNCTVGATALNDRSSRSHSCLTVHVQGRDMTSGTILRGCMHLVDLAGSERVDKSEVTGERLKEAQHINKSLSALGDVISALAHKNSHVPYRNSKLTQLLQDSLGRQAKTLMFVHISPDIDAIGETISTLKFAERVSSVELGAAQLNKESGEVKELREQVACLKAALARKGGGSEHLQNIIASPDMLNVKTPSPINSNHQHGQEYVNNQTNHRKPMEDVGNIEINPSLKQKKPSIDLQELLMANDSPPWPDSSRINFQVGEYKETDPGNWVDKVMVNKHETVIQDNNSIRDWDGDSAPLPDFFYQKYVSNMEAYPEQPYQRNATRRKDSHDFGMQGNRFYSVGTDDSDDLDIATSDSSEADTLWQFNLQNINTAVNEGASRINKHQMPTKSPDIRYYDLSGKRNDTFRLGFLNLPASYDGKLYCSGRKSRTPNHIQIPTPSRKALNGSNRTGRQPYSSSSDGKRIT
uniref:Kinesin-like protein KIN-14F isoform X3 n=1 Tax=Elaeis guineensis var. tenera TaxID=51953 RepID=A0A6J0PQW8_ELAGV|nr:kinesin-like protein KIN-14F isoform X3 [Elaeis guineensis]